MIVMRLASGIRSHFVTRLPEWILAVVLIVAATNLMENDQSFDISPAYAVLARVTTEATMAKICGFIGISWLVALFLNGTFLWFRRVSPWVRTLAAFAAASYWAFTALAIALAIPTSPGVINNVGFGSIALAYSVLIAREVGVADREAKKCRRSRQIP